MASYAPSLAQVGIICERRDVLADGPRPPRIAATGTLPPVREADHSDVRVFFFVPVIVLARASSHLCRACLNY